MISLAQLHDQLGRDLAPATGGPVARRQISGVHISELEDPTPYLEGGELLLTTGIPVSGGTEKVRSYVQRLVDRGIAALGLGLGAGTDEVPPQLQAACAEAGLELLIVPAGTPFMLVSRTYWDLVARMGQADLAARLGTQTALAKAATQPDALVSVVRALAQALGGWAAYLPADESAETLWPATVRGVLPALRQETGRLNMAATHSAATFQVHGTDVVEYPILAGGRVAGFLAIGAGRKLAKADRQVIMTVCVLLSLKAQQRQETADTSSALGAAVAKLVLKGYVEAARALAADLGLQLPESIRLLVVNGRAGSGAPALPGSAAETAAGVAALACTDAWAPLEEAVRGCTLRYSDAQFTYLILAADPPRRPPTGYPDASGSPVPDCAAALSQPVSLHRAAQMAGEVSRAARAAAVGTLTMVGSLTDPRAEGWVNALGAYPRADLTATVRSYLRHRGHWETAARELGIHRNSLRHRIAIAGRLIGVDLDDPDVGANLWLALRRAG